MSVAKPDNNFKFLTSERSLDNRRRLIASLISMKFTCLLTNRALLTSPVAASVVATLIANGNAPSIISFLTGSPWLKKAV